MASSTSQEILQQYSGMVELAVENANPNNWEWDARTWELADKGWQDLNTEWYGATARSLGGPESPSLSLPYLGDWFPSILVRESYVTTFDRIWARAMQSGGRIGTIITGQPGTGKTLFQYYLLVRLLQRKQVVLFSQNGRVLFLFYHDKVYQSTTSELEGRGRLPEPKSWSLNVFIWSLFDIEEMKAPNSILIKPPCLPVQTASPDPCRYKTWQKERFPLLTALPLWTRDELVAGFPFQRMYPDLMNALRLFYSSTSENRDIQLFGFPGASEVLKEREGDDVSPSPDDALNYLLEEAIDRFGYAARDVFGAVFNHHAVTELHEHAFIIINYSRLQDAITALAGHGSPTQDISHEILALSPVSTGAFKNDRWTLDFKSDWIAKCVVQKLGEAEDAAIRQQIKFLGSIPGASSLAERFFEPVIHKIITTSTDGIWPLIRMASNDLDPPQFAVTRDSPPVADDVQFAKAKREIVKFQDLTGLSLKDNTYYVPEDKSLPLFDAFTVDIDYAKKSAILWVLQITTSKSRGGSSRCYRKIREIVAKLKHQLGEDPPLKKAKVSVRSKPLVQVHYLLLVLEGIPRNPWQFPKGWNVNYSRDDHRGEVYCLEIPLAVPSAGLQNTSLSF